VEHGEAKAGLKIGPARIQEAEKGAEDVELAETLLPLCTLIEIEPINSKKNSVA
jgi:hypothetical protein